MTPYIICGHGAGDSGACAHGYQEAERVRALGAEIKRLGGNSVVLMDTSRNWYADKGLNTYPFPDDAAIVELHMDSLTATSRGGHVIIPSGYGGADELDTRLVSVVTKFFPGRAVTLDERSDLANCNRAKARGLNYRLVENGFISNADDLDTFNSHLTDIARAYLDAFGVAADESAPSAPSTPATPSEPAKGPIGTALLLDCDAGIKTWSEWAKQLGLSGSDADGYINYQYTGNRKYLKNVSSAIYAWYKGCPGSPTVKAVQRRIGSRNVDGVWGAVDTENLKAYMKEKWGYKMTTDGYGVFGANTAYNVQHSLNQGLWRQ